MKGWTVEALKEVGIVVGNDHRARRVHAVAEKSAAKQAKPGKFNNTLTEGPCPLGGTRTYHSAAEAAAARELDMLKRTSAILAWSAQVSFPVRKGPRGVVRHQVDFLAVELDGRMRLIECKGFDHPGGKAKRLDLEAMGFIVELRR